MIKCNKINKDDKEFERDNHTKHIINGFKLRTLNDSIKYLHNTAFKNEINSTGCNILMILKFNKDQKDEIKKINL